MDPVIRTGLAIGLGVMIKNIIMAWWDRYQERKAREPIQMKLKNGVYVPWGPVQRIRRAMDIGLKVWLVYMAGLLIALAYVKLF